MRTNHRWMTGLAMSACLLFPGCLDKYEVTTVVSTDGTCERVITLKRDSQKLPSGAFPVPVDSSWTCTWSETTKATTTGSPGGGGKEYLYSAKKRFADFEGLSREYPPQRDPGNLSIRVRVEEKFRWFYTYYAYDETYERFDPLHDPIQPTAFLTPEEIQRFMASEKPDSLLEAKWKLWDQRKKEEWAFARLIDLVRRKNDPALPVSLFERNKERLISALSHDSTSGREATRKKAQKGVPSPEDHHGAVDENVLEVMASVLGTRKVRGLSAGLDSLAAEFFRRDSVAGRANGAYTNTVIVPGVIVETNAQEVRGTTAVWRFNNEHLALADYRMTVESRVVNLWAMVLSGIVVLIAVVFPVSRRRRHGI
jgi:hypothetical protein